MKDTENALQMLDYEYGKEDEKRINLMLSRYVGGCDRVFVVIDDDPTGGQTVNGIDVYTGWTREDILGAFKKPDYMFYIMTNSRSLLAEETAAVQKEIMQNLLYASEITNRRFEVISRGDSTLRGHYPLETDVLKECISEGDIKELVIPYFREGNRYTIEDIHYLYEEGRLIPAGESEFSRDRTFGYHNSDLKLWIEEKTKGSCPAGNVGSISLEMLRKLDFHAIIGVLSNQSYEKIIVNAACDMDLKVFAICYHQMLMKGVRFIARTASSWPKAVGNIAEIPYIQAEDIADGNNRCGGLIIIGSHVNKTTKQLEELKKSSLRLEYIEFNQQLVLNPEQLKQEIRRVWRLANEAIAGGITAAVYTRRERIDLNTGNREDELMITRQIADAVTEIAGGIDIKPRFVIVKGGITSSDIAVKAFRTKRAKILGQVIAGVPVWRLGEESRYPGLAYIIFPGNVGDKDALKTVVQELTRKQTDQ